MESVQTEASLASLQEVIRAHTKHPFVLFCSILFSYCFHIFILFHHIKSYMVS